MITRVIVKKIFEKLGWLTVYERLDLITLKQAYKCLYDDGIDRNTLRQLPLRNTGPNEKQQI